MVLQPFALRQKAVFSIKKCILALVSVVLSLLFDLPPHALVAQWSQDYSWIRICLCSFVKLHKMFYTEWGSPHFVISQFVIHANWWFCFRPQFREFLSISWFWRKKIQKKIFFSVNFFGFSKKNIFYSFLFIYSDCHIKIFLLDMTIARNSKGMYT